MTTKPTFSNNKIILAVVFISAALITSLFVFHMSHRAPMSSLPQEQGLIFPTGRDIKSFELMTANGQPFSEKNLQQHWTLLFFGFTHCSSICPTTLTMLNRVYPDLIAKHPDLQVVLVSLDPERDSADVLSKYAASFNPSFIGVSGKTQNLRKLQSDFGVYSARDDQSNNNYQLQHTASIFLINPHGQWAGILNNDMKPSQFTKAFQDSIHFLSQQPG